MLLGGLLRCWPAQCCSGALATCSGNIFMFAKGNTAWGSVPPVSKRASSALWPSPYRGLCTQPWDLALVLEFPADDAHPEAVGAGMDRFVMEARPAALLAVRVHQRVPRPWRPACASQLVCFIGLAVPAAGAGTSVQVCLVVTSSTPHVLCRAGADGDAAPQQGGAQGRREVRP